MHHLEVPELGVAAAGDDGRLKLRRYPFLDLINGSGQGQGQGQGQSNEDRVRTNARLNHIYVFISVSMCV